MVLLAHPAPREYFPVPPVPPKEHGIEGPFPQSPGGPRGGPAQPPVHLWTRGRGSPPRGSRIASHPEPNGSWPQRDAGPPPLPAPAPPTAPAPYALVPCRIPAPPGRRPSSPAPPVAPVPRGRGCAGRHCVGGGAAGGGAGGLRGGSGPPCRCRCCRWAGGVVGYGAPAYAGYRGGCTTLPGFPAGGAPCPSSPVLCPPIAPQTPCPVLPARGGPRHLPLRWPWAVSPGRPLALVRSVPPPPARVSCFSLCRPRPCFSHRCWRPCPSCVPTHAPCRALCPSLCCPCPCLSSAPALPRCCLHWRPARAATPCSHHASTCAICSNASRKQPCTVARFVISLSVYSFIL